MPVDETDGGRPHSAIDEALAWAVVELAPNAILLVDRGGRVLLANQQADEMFGATPGQLVGGTVEDLVPPEIRGRHAELRDRYHADPHTRPMGAGLDLHARRCDGTLFPVEIALSPLEHAGEATVVVIIRDITDRLEGERQLQAARQELSVLEDRERIARDLHDTVIQRLFAAGMSLQAATAQAEPTVAGRVNAVIDELDETIRDIRQAIFRLTAHTLDRTSLRRQLMTVVEQEEEVLGLAPEVRFHGPVESVPDELGEHLLAVLREALSNVGRHARASRVLVDLEVGDELTLTVDDDGVGVDPDAVPGGGTANLRERAEVVNGSIEVAPNRPRGTRLRWAAPIDR